MKTSMSNEDLAFVWFCCYWIDDIPTSYDDKWERFKNIEKELSRPHQGDCTHESQTCMRCVAEDCQKMGKIIHEIIEYCKKKNKQYPD